ncbi:MAG TPA: glycosyltransferase [Gemmatimonadales bacterium]|nr:glycosyltransferase [Gemmatimonadales bacterium]
MLLSRFPLVTETFILREIEELERQGQPVRLVPLVREHPAVVHREAQAWLPRALFTPYVSPAILAANVRAFVRRPYQYVRLFGRVLLGCLRSVNVLARTVALFPKCVYLAERLEREGIRHVHAHYATHPATAALVISSLAPITFSFTAHAHDIFVAWRRPLLGLKVRRACFIRVISAFNQTFLRALYPESAGKLRVIHVGIEPDRYRPVSSSRLPANAPRAEPGGGGKGTGDGLPRVLCVAALQPYKGVSVLIEACGRLKAMRARFLCEVVGDGRLRAELEDQIARAGLGDRVRLRGALRQDEVAALLGQAAIVVLPSVVASDGQMEGIPVALMEAMAAERPVIAPAISGVPELVDHGVTGLLVEPGNPDALADAIAALLADPERRRQLGRRGREQVLRAFRLDACAAALLRDLDQWNPPPAPSEGLHDLAARAGFKGHHLGVRRVHGGQDSTVIELLAADGRRVHELILKTHRSRPGASRAATARAQHEHDVLVRLQPWFADGDAAGNGMSLRAPRPLTDRPSDASIALERCGGDPLHDLIRRARQDPEGEGWTSLDRAVRAAGHWVDRLQEVTRRDDPDAARRAWDALIDGARRDLASCVDRTMSSRTAGSIRQRLEAMRPCLPPGSRPVGCHGDLSPGNILAAPASLAVIDFEGFHEGLPWEDVAYFLVHLELYFVHPRRAAGLARLQDAFLAASRVAPDPLALDLCRTVAALKALRALAQGRSWRGWYRARLLRRLALGREGR